MEKYKGKLYLLIFVLTAGILAWGAWNNYKPQVIYASCADIAQKTTNIRKRTEIAELGQDEFDINLTDCLEDVGYFQEN